MKIKLLLPFLLFSIFLHAQESFDFEKLKEAGIKTIEASRVKVIDGEFTADTIFTLNMVLNENGRPTEEYNCFRNKYCKHIVYAYSEDGRLLSKTTTKKTKKGGKSVIVYQYTKKGDKKSETHFRDDKKSTELFFEYDKEDRLSTKVMHLVGKGKATQKYMYDKAGNLIEINSENTQMGCIRFEYDERGNSVRTFREKEKGSMNEVTVNEYNEKYELIVRETHYIKAPKKTPPWKSYTIEKGDILKKEFDYDENGLKVSEKEFLNNELIGMKSYQYSMR